MSTRERPPLGFETELDEFDPVAWPASKAKNANDKLKPADAKKAAEAAGFRSREPEKPQLEKTSPRMQRRRRTGRNVQLNIKTRQDTIDAFIAVADAKGWGIGETFEYATELLTREAKVVQKNV